MKEMEGLGTKYFAGRGYYKQELMKEKTATYSRLKYQGHKMIKIQVENFHQRKMVDCSSSKKTQVSVYQLVFD